MLMTNGMPFCSATWAIAVLWPESNAPGQELRAVVDQLLARAGATSTDVSVSAFDDDGELGQTELLEDGRRDLDPALAILPDAGLGARAGQEHTHLQGPGLCADDLPRRRRKDAGDARTQGKAAAGHTRTGDFVGDLATICVLPNENVSSAWPISYCCVQDAMGGRSGSEPRWHRCQGLSRVTRHPVVAQNVGLRSGCGMR